jgi:hypothetical protein
MVGGSAGSAPPPGRVVRDDVALQLYIVRNLLKAELAGTQDPHLGGKSLVGVVSYLLGAAAAWGPVHPAFLIYMLTPVFFIVPPPVGVRRPGGRRALRVAIFAMSALSLVPVLAVFIVFQRYLVQGISTTGMKG